MFIFFYINIYNSQTLITKELYSAPRVPMAHLNELTTEAYKHISADGLSPEDAALFEEAKRTFNPNTAVKEVPYKMSSRVLNALKQRQCPDDVIEQCSSFEEQDVLFDAYVYGVTVEQRQVLIDNGYDNIKYWKKPLGQKLVDMIMQSIPATARQVNAIKAAKAKAGDTTPIPNKLSRSGASVEITRLHNLRKREAWQEDALKALGIARNCWPTNFWEAKAMIDRRKAEPPETPQKKRARTQD